MFDHKAYPDSQSKTYVYEVLRQLSYCRLAFAVLALVFALWSFRGTSRVASMVALAFAMIAVFTLFLIM